MKYLIYFILALGLVGCGSMKASEIVEHKVMVTVPCKITPPEKPVMPLTDTGEKSDTIFVKSKKAIAEIDIRKGYEAELEAAIGTCQ